ncbi:class D sortase [Anaerobacillus sp. CMMVII]|nr:class D sortase [Anaerobacillus sp. CMMVII]MCT8137666.1 class D sortase [Anaerobacillus sp. CMMVII]
MKQLVLLSFSICIITAGLWFSGTNGYKFLKGYLLFKTGNINVYEELDETIEVVKASKIEEQELYPERPRKGDMIGNLYIPKLDANLPIFHGTDEDELEKGVGHFMGSVLPGENDNSVLSGHRDTVFRRLGEVGENDLLIVTTSAGEFTYKVKRVRIVDEDDRTVIVPRPRPTLTLSTCYPFDFIGSAPERYILVANLVK